ncbi:MAG: LysM peptidoglycan-binding domain-containing protein [Planctomycetota bacterium]|jgi:hypothetical protein
MCTKIFFIIALLIAVFLFHGCRTIPIKNQANQYKPYTIKAGDTFWHIAEKQLGDGNRCHEIVKLNHDILEENFPCMVGTVLKIPADACQTNVNPTAEVNLKTSDNTVQNRTDANTVVLDVPLTNEQKFGKYTVRTYREEEGPGAFYEILINGFRRYAEYDEVKFTIGTDSCDINPLITMGKDITGNGIPNLVIENFNGSAHGGGYFVVFELGENLRKLNEIYATGGEYFCDLDGDSNLEFVTYDNTFVFWYGCSHAGSPYPKVVLRYNHNGYHIAIDQMRKAAPQQQTLIKRAESFRNDERCSLRPYLFRAFRIRVGILRYGLAGKCAG